MASSCDFVKSTANFLPRSPAHSRSFYIRAAQGKALGRSTQSVYYASAVNRNCQPTKAKVAPFARRLAQLSFQVVGRFTVSAVTGRPV